MSCAAARAAGHRLLDGDRLDSAARAGFDAHLAVCGECREWFEDQTALQDGLRRLPAAPFPDRALEELWAATSGGPAARRFDWRPLAAAAVLTLALLAWPGLLRDSAGPAGSGAQEPSPAEIARATEEARLAFRLAAAAINRAERTAVRQIVDEVSPALSEVPIRWSISEEDDDEKRQGV